MYAQPCRGIDSRKATMSTSTSSCAEQQVVQGEPLQQFAHRRQSPRCGGVHRSGTNQLGRPLDDAAPVRAMRARATESSANHHGLGHIQLLALGLVACESTSCERGCVCEKLSSSSCSSSWRQLQSGLGVQLDGLGHGTAIKKHRPGLTVAERV